MHLEHMQKTNEYSMDPRTYKIASTEEQKGESTAEEKIFTSDITSVVEFTNPKLHAFMQSAVESHGQVENLNEQVLFFINKSDYDAIVRTFNTRDQTQFQYSIYCRVDLLSHFKIKDNRLALVDVYGVQIWELNEKENVLTPAKDILFPGSLKEELYSMSRDTRFSSCSIQMSPDGTRIGILKRNVEFYLVDLLANKITEYWFPNYKTFSFGFIFDSADEIITKVLTKEYGEKWHRIKLCEDGTFKIISGSLDYQTPVALDSVFRRYRSLKLKNFRVEETEKHKKHTSFFEYNVFPASNSYQKIGTLGSQVPADQLQTFPSQDMFCYLSGYGKFHVWTGKENILSLSSFSFEKPMPAAKTVKVGDTGVLIASKEKMLAVIFSFSKELEKALPKNIPLPLIKIMTSYLGAPEIFPFLAHKDTTVVKHSMFTSPAQALVFEQKFDEIHLGENLQSFIEAFYKFACAKFSMELSFDTQLLLHIATCLRDLFCKLKGNNLVEGYVSIYNECGLVSNYKVKRKIQDELKDDDIFANPNNFAKDLVRYIAMKDDKQESSKILAVIQKFKIDKLAEKIQEALYNKSQLVHTPS